MAAPRFVASLLCFIGTAQGLSLVQSRASWSSSVSSPEAFGEDGPPDTTKIETILENLNSSLDQVSDVINASNGTAYRIVGGLLHSIATMQDNLAALSAAEDAAAQVPGAEDVATKAKQFIDQANSTLQKAQKQVPATLDKTSTKLASIVPELAKLADKATTKYEDAVNLIVQDICNHTGQNLTKKFDRTMEQWKVRHQKSETNKSEKRHQHTRKTGETGEAAALLEYRVHQMRRPVGGSNVDEAIWNKGNQQSSKAKATKDISQANATEQSLSDKIAQVNATIADLLSSQLDAVFQALEKVNATIAPHLADLPGNLAQPVSTALDTFLSHKDDLQSIVDNRLSEVASGIQDAIGSLDNVVPLADVLQAAVDECTNVNSTKESGAAEGTEESGAAEGTEESGAAGSTEASTADDNGTAN